MRAPYTQLYVHLVWATWDRLPLVTPEVQRTLYQSFRVECQGLNAEIIAVGGMEDHVHLLVRFPTTVSIAKLVQQVKGASSHLITSKTGEAFRWQGGYGAFTVSKALVPRIREYIRDQEKHHREDTFFPALEPPPVGGADSAG
jgi:putative transposase